MKTTLNYIVALFFLISLCCFGQKKNNDKPIVIANDFEYKDDYVHFTGTDNLIFLPENRLDKDSRKIGIQFFRVKAKNDKGLPPVLYLPGGPTGVFVHSMFGRKYGGKHGIYFGEQVSLLNEDRDVLVINQRGCHYVPGAPVPDFTYKFKTGNPKEMSNPEQWKKNLKKAFVANAKYFTESGIDLSGYDFSNLVDDIESIRKYYNYEKVAFMVGSFGAQWALGYISRYPNKIDRVLAYDIEPLSHSYDDPKHLWEVFKNIASEAEKSPKLKGKLPKIGLLNAVKEIAKRLEKEPVWVQVGSDSLQLGIEDFKRNLRYPYGPTEAWPKYITELYNGDYKLLGLWAKERRGGIGNVAMINSLIDVSIGISKERHKLVNSREELQWMRTSTLAYDALKDVIMTPDIGDDMREIKSNNIPMVILQANMDVNTPFKNAEYVLPYFKNTHVIKLENVAHQGRVHLWEEHPESLENIMRLFTTDFDKVPFSEFKKTLKSKYTMKKFDFMDIDGKSLYEMRTGN